ncbi:MAG: hypothetical protein JNM72_16650 [Deltaproteobacteria bacterium]|nr:hypothetical protein [Deltaproteobacteria bacterium]
MSSGARVGLRWAGLRAALLGLALAGCAGGEEAEALAKASTEIVFDSMDKLGAHHSLSSLRQTLTRPSGEVEPIDDAIEIKWQDWDHFEHRRVADGRQGEAVRVVDGVAYVARGGAEGSWEQRPDADGYRAELRASWSQWDQALGPFADRLELRDEGEEVIEGRPARRYSVHLAPADAPAPAPAAKAKGKGKTKAKAAEAPPPPADPLIALKGALWVDAATAVRLVAEIEGERRQGDKALRFTYNLAVSAVGQDQELTVPVHIEPAAAPVPPATLTPTDAPGEGGPTEAPRRPRSPRKR